MAIIKVKGIKDNPIKNLKYIVDPVKTNQGMLVEGVNTFSNYKKANTDMLNCRLHYGIKKKNQLFHVVISFNGKDKLDPVTAHEISKKFASKVFPKNSMYVMATHTNTQNLHTHFSVNSCTKEGISFSLDRVWHRKAVEVSNRLCAECGLVNSITKQKPCRKRVRGHYEWDNIRNGTSYKEEIRNKIDSIIPVVNSKEELFSLLNAEGISFKEGKHCMMLKHPQAKRYMNFYALGNGYALQTLERYIRIYNKYPDTKYASKQYAKGILNAIDLINNNGKDLKNMNEELQRLKTSNDPLDKIRVKELSKEIRDTLEADRYLKSIHMSLEDRLKAKQELFKEIKPYKEKEREVER